MLLHQPIERPFAQLCGLRSEPHIPRMGQKQMLDVLPLESLRRLSLGRVIRKVPTRFRNRSKSQVSRIDTLSFRLEYRAMDRVVELPDISGPTV